VDCRGDTVVTIDPEDAKDFDFIFLNFFRDVF
jgi:exoribonuclease R